MGLSLKVRDMATRLTVEIAYDVPRVEEKLLAKAASMQNFTVKLTNVRQTPLTLERIAADVTLVRCVSMYAAIHTAAMRESVGVKAINNTKTILYAGDKVLTVSCLHASGIAVPRIAVGLDAEAAEKALEKVGLPAVDKPPIGSWGRLVAFVKDYEDFKLVREHREMIPTSYMKTHLIQEYIDLPNRDIRTLVIGDEVVGAMYRYRPSDDWRTNVALGGQPVSAYLNEELKEISLKAAEAIGGGVVSVDVFETETGSYLVNEVNGVPEFKGLMQAIGVDIPGKIIEYAYKAARR